jgi:hypothetical protein
VDVTFVVPSKLTFQARSPVIAMFLAFVSLFAEATTALEKSIFTLVAAVILPFESTVKIPT